MKTLPLLSAFVCIFLVSACDSQTTNSKSEPVNPARPSSVQPYDYFPTAIGTKWSYVVTVNDASDKREDKPLQHNVVVWPQGEGGLRQQSRGLIYWSEEQAKTKRLVLELKAKAPQQGPLSYPEGYEISIEQDDLNIYRDAKNLYWAITSSSGYQVTEVLMYDPSAPGAPKGGLWGSYGQEDGYGMKVHFFGEAPGISIGLSGQGEKLLFVSFTKLDGADCMHFQRIVDPAEDDGKDRDYLDNGFTEDMWFVKGVGLAKLVQKVNGKVTMTWVLEE